MDAELDFADDNDLIAVHDEARGARADADQFAESEEGDEFENESNDESGGSPASVWLPEVFNPSQYRGPLQLQLQREPDMTAAPLPPHLKEISSLAAWTVSTHKPGCGVAALCHPSTAQFWQSDGPQPHFLNIHFFKMVAIAHMRVFLDYEQDESYTPKKLHFLAGTGHHDLQDVCTMVFQKPKGWLEVDLSNAGGPNPFEDGDFDDEDWEGKTPRRRGRRPGHGPTLRCRLVQLRILENDQNGKDTHLRGLKLFAIDETAIRVRRRRKISLKGADPLYPASRNETVSSVLPGKSEEIPVQSRPNSHGMNVGVPQWPLDPLSSPLTGFDAAPGAVQQPDQDTLTGQRNTQSTALTADRKSRRSTRMVGLREPDWMSKPLLR